MSRENESQRDPSKADLDDLQLRIDARREKYKPAAGKAHASA